MSHLPAPHGLPSLAATTGSASYSSSAGPYGTSSSSAAAPPPPPPPPLNTNFPPHSSQPSSSSSHSAPPYNSHRGSSSSGAAVSDPYRLSPVGPPSHPHSHAHSHPHSLPHSHAHEPHTPTAHASQPPATSLPSMRTIDAMHPPPSLHYSHSGHGSHGSHSSHTDHPPLHDSHASHTHHDSHSPHSSHHNYPGPPNIPPGPMPYQHMPAPYGMPPYGMPPYGLPGHHGLPDMRMSSYGLGTHHRHKKEIKRRTKTGCMTCRKRRIKCDETHPTCNNCKKSKRECAGYDPIFKPQPNNPGFLQPTAHIPPPSTTTTATAPSSSSHQYSPPPLPSINKTGPPSAPPLPPNIASAYAPLKSPTGRPPPLPLPSAASLAPGPLSGSSSSSSSGNTIANLYKSAPPVSNTPPYHSSSHSGGALSISHLNNASPDDQSHLTSRSSAPTSAHPSSHPSHPSSYYSSGSYSSRPRALPTELLVAAPPPRLPANTTNTLAATTMKVDEIIGKTAPVPLTQPALPLTRETIDDITKAFYEVYVPGLSSFFETTWYNLKPGGSSNPVTLLLNNEPLMKLLASFMASAAQVSTRDLAANEMKAASAIELRVIWALATLAYTVPATAIITNPNQPYGSSGALPDDNAISASDARSRLAVVDALLSGRSEFSPSTTASTTASGFLATPAASASSSVSPSSGSPGPSSPAPASSATSASTPTPQHPYTANPCMGQARASDQSRVREYKFWWWLGQFVQLHQASSKGKENRLREREHALARMRSLLDGRENRDVLYSVAVLREMASRTPAGFDMSSATILNLDESDPRNKLAVAVKFIRSEAQLPGANGGSGGGSTNVVRRFAQIAVRALIHPGYSVVRAQA
ncbi:negative acting factor [Ophiostoma piceae UAMH 11346]|uniref:Negative acting factor n=1 Tax=Ophiostoma piceae (strain UAMH 11346) TaxID=1262450 RepID=S3CEM9_OPHP1|nr:negative acting factor [Ophiostoma piceae UAMH 11346]